MQPAVYGPASEKYPQYWIHNLEHGYVVLAYRCPSGVAGQGDCIPPADLDKIQAVVRQHAPANRQQLRQESRWPSASTRWILHSPCSPGTARCLIDDLRYRDGEHVRPAVGRLRRPRPSAERVSAERERASSRQRSTRPRRASARPCVHWSRKRPPPALPCARCPFRSPVRASCSSASRQRASAARTSTSSAGTSGRRTTSVRRR